MKGLAAALTIACLAASPAASFAAATISVGAVWSRPATGTAVVYATMTDRTSTADRLLRVTSPIAAHVELHESTASPMGAEMSGMSGSIMSMRRVRSIPVPAHATVQIRPGGYHIMLIGLKHDLHAGESFPIDFTFARAGKIGATVHVRAMEALL